MTVNDASGGADPAGVVTALEDAARRHESPCGDGALVWRDWGEGPPLVLLHGGFGSWTHWVRNVPGLARSWRVVAVDLPGLGDSAMPPEPVDPASLGAIVAGGLASLVESDEPVRLVGFSFGGLVGGQVARLLGSRAAALVLGGASGLGVRRPPIELVRREPEMSEDARADALRENLSRLMLHAPASIDALALHVHAGNDARARLRSRRMSLGDSLRRVLPELDATVHGIWGEHDATCGPWLDERRAIVEGCGPASRFEAIPGAGHWVQYEAPDAFGRALAALLGR